MKEGDSSCDVFGFLGGIWGNICVLFGDMFEFILCEQIEEVIDEYEGDLVFDEKGDLLFVECQMVCNLLSFGKCIVDDVGVLCVDIVVIFEIFIFVEFVVVFVDVLYSCLLVYCDSFDEVVGMIYIKDVFVLLVCGVLFFEIILGLICQLFYVFQFMGVFDLFVEMCSQCIYFVIVIDEYLGIEGFVMIEDLVEEIVGDIEDEIDDVVVFFFVQLDDGMWDVDVWVELEDVVEIIDLCFVVIDEDVDMIGGFVFVLVGYVLQLGEMLMYGSGWWIEVMVGDGWWVICLCLYLLIIEIEVGVMGK